MLGTILFLISLCPTSFAQQKGHAAATMQVSVRVVSSALLQTFEIPKKILITAKDIKSGHIEVGALFAVRHSNSFGLHYQVSHKALQDWVTGIYGIQRMGENVLSIDKDLTGFLIPFSTTVSVLLELDRKMKPGEYETPLEITEILVHAL